MKYNVLMKKKMLLSTSYRQETKNIILRACLEQDGSEPMLKESHESTLLTGFYVFHMNSFSHGFFPPPQIQMRIFALGKKKKNTNQNPQLKKKSHPAKKNPTL